MFRRLPVRRGVIFIALLVIFFSLEFREDGAAPRPGNPNPVSETANLNGRKITVLTNHPHIRSAQTLAEWFRRETGAVVQNIVISYEKMLGYALEDVASLNPKLDIIMFWYVDLGALVEHHALADLTDFIRKNRKIIRPGDFIPNLYDPYTLYKGKRRAVPYDGDTHVLFYRKSLLEKYRLTPPETWDEYLGIAKIITGNEKARGVYGTAIMAPPIPMIIVSTFMNRLGSYGGRLLDENGKSAISSKEAVMAVSAFTEHVQYALPTPLETDWEVSRDAFLSGSVAMVEQWTDIGVMAEELSQSVIQGDWGAVQMPKGKGSGARHASALNAGFSLGMSTRASDPETALAYLLFASRPDITLRLNLINGGIDPTRISVLTSAKYRTFAPELSAAVHSAIKSSVAWPTIPQTPQLLGILTNNLILAAERRKTPRDAAEDTHVQWCEILK